MLILNCEQTRKLEQSAVDNGCTYLGLMERAGREAAAFIQQALSQFRRKTVILCGSGNNGGDGFVVARCLAGWSGDVLVVMLSGQPRTGDALTMYQKARETAGVRFSGYPDDRLEKEIQEADLIVDGIYGIGFHGAVMEEYLPVIRWTNRSAAKVVSLDLPSGVACDFGKVEGEAVQADYTVTFSALKLSQVQYPAMEYCGEIHVANVGIPEKVYRESGFEAETTGLWALERILAPRKLNTNKGSFGYLLSLCGSRGMAGAAVMSAQAASRCGVGLIDLALPESVYPAAASAIRESVFTLLPEQENEISISEAEALLSGKLAHRTTACLVGCGLGTSREAQKLVEYLLAHSKAPMVIDADGLNAIAAEPEMLSKAQAPLVLTPHPGEMARLLKTTVQDVQRHRLEYAKEFAVKQRLVLVLKGNKTVVACPDGRVYINTTGNPGMAKAGSGDVLAGIIGAFLAQGMAPEQAAAGGVYLHGLAGDRCAERLSQIGMTAPDLIEELPALFLELTATK